AGRRRQPRARASAPAADGAGGVSTKPGEVREGSGAVRSAASLRGARRAGELRGPARRRARAPRAATAATRRSGSGRRAERGGRAGGERLGQAQARAKATVAGAELR